MMMTDFASPFAPCPAIPDDMTVPQFLLDSSHPLRPIRNDHSPWLIEDATRKTVTAEEVRQRTAALANGMKRRFGIRENDVVCIFSPNDIEYPIAIWATHRLGAVVSTANPNYTPSELTHQLTTTLSSLIISSSEATSISTAIEAAKQSNIPLDRIVFMRPPSIKNSGPSLSFVTIDDLVEEGRGSHPIYIEPRLNEGEAKTRLAFLSFSSGTTGRAKAVAIPHYAVVANIIQMAKQNGVNGDYAPKDKQRFRVGDRAGAVLPFFHIYGLVVNMHYILFCGLSIVVIPKFSFEPFMQSIVRYKITHLLLVPPMIVLMCKHPAAKKYNLSHVRWCMSGAAPLSKELTEQFMKVVPNADIGQSYGMTETCTVLTQYPYTQRYGALGSAGQLVPGVIARVVKEDGSVAGVGEIGELWVTGPQMALRYEKNEFASNETFINGWVRTGDEVYIDAHNEVFVVDRLKEILKVRGFQVAPAELEGHLLDHPDISDACVVGIPDAYSGEIPMAFVVLEEKAATRVKDDGNSREATMLKSSIENHVRAAKVQYKWLAGGVEFVDSIPKNPSGKLLRRLMRDKAKQLLKARNEEALKAKL